MSIVEVSYRCLPQNELRQTLCVLESLPCAALLLQASPFCTAILIHSDPHPSLPRRVQLHAVIVAASQLPHSPSTQIGGATLLLEHCYTGELGDEVSKMCLPFFWTSHADDEYRRPRYPPFRPSASPFFPPPPHHHHPPPPPHHHHHPPPPPPFFPSPPSHYRPGNDYDYPPKPPHHHHPEMEYGPEPPHHHGPPPQHFPPPPPHHGGHHGHHR